MSEVVSLESFYNDYEKIKKAHATGELSEIHMQGALAYLELKAQDAGIVFVAPELKRSSDNYKIPENRPTGELLKKGIIEDENSEEDMYIETLDDNISSEMFDSDDGSDETTDEVKTTETK